MNKQHESLINELAQGLNNKQTKLLPTKRLSIVWLAFYTIATFSNMWWIAPFRETVLTQLFTVPRFALESVLGLSSCILLTYSAFQSSIPGRSNTLVYVSSMLTAIWIGHIALGLHTPTLASSMHDKRELCFLEVIFYSVPACLFLFWIVARRYSLNPISTGLLSGFSAGLLPALLMQFACIYDAQHGLTFHILPGVLAGIVFGLAIGIFVKIHRQKNKTR